MSDLIYDTYSVEGNCQRCKKPTEWHIAGRFPVCKECMVSLMDDACEVLSIVSGYEFELEVSDE